MTTITNLNDLKTQIKNTVDLKAYLEKEGTLPFSKTEISQKVRTDYEQKVIKRLKDHLATLK